MTQIGIIGGGNISETHARAAREIEGVKIAAIYGHNREKQAEPSAHWKQPPLFIPAIAGAWS